MDPPLVVPFDDLTDPGTTPDELEKQIRSLVQKYRRSLSDHHHPIEEFDDVHSARKIVGVGSVGTRAGFILCRPRRSGSVVPAVEGSRSVGVGAIRRQERVRGARPSSRCWSTVDASGQRHLPRLVPRQSPTAGSATTTCASSTTGRAASTWRVSGCRGRRSTPGFAGPPARAHARWGDRIAIATYLGKGNAFDKAIADFAAQYADQNERDFDVRRSGSSPGALRRRRRPDSVLEHDLRRQLIDHRGPPARPNSRVEVHVGRREGDERQRHCVNNSGDDVGCGKRRVPQEDQKHP